MFPGRCRYCDMFDPSRSNQSCQETPTFTHLGDTYFYALIVLEPKRALGRGEG